jgi:hypothetical protein
LGPQKGQYAGHRGSEKTKRGLFDCLVFSAGPESYSNRSNSCYGARGLRARGPPVRVSRGAQRGPRGLGRVPERKSPRKGPGKAKEVAVCVLKKRRKEKNRIKGSFRIR